MLFGVYCLGQILFLFSLALIDFDLSFYLLLIAPFQTFAQSQSFFLSFSMHNTHFFERAQYFSVNNRIPIRYVWLFFFYFISSFVLFSFSQLLGYVRKRSSDRLTFFLRFIFIYIENQIKKKEISNEHRLFKNSKTKKNYTAKFI